MKFNTINFNHEEITFKEELNDMEIMGIERVASEVLNLDINGFSYNGGSLSYHPLENEKINGLEISHFKMTSELYLFLKDENSKFTVLRLEYV